LVLWAALLLAACSGGGGGVDVPFSLVATSPQDGEVGAPIDAPIAVNFSLPADLSTITGETLWIERYDGQRIGATILKQISNGSAVRIEPTVPLQESTRFRIVVGPQIRARDSDTTLGVTREACFVTGSRLPSVRLDQVVDLGDVLNEPRYLARWVRTAEGRHFVIGGYRDDTTASATVEEWLPEERKFVLAGELLVPRAEHGASLMTGGAILVTGGRSVPGGPPLKSTEFFVPGQQSSEPGPEMLEARSYHAASPHLSGETVMVTGGFGADGAPLASAEFLRNGVWESPANGLPKPSAQHLQVNFGREGLYVGTGNLQGAASTFNGEHFIERSEDVRFRSTAARLESDRLLVVGGDTRSALIYDFSSDLVWHSTDFLHSRRGEHTLTRRADRQYLIAGGFNIAAFGKPPLATLELVDYLPSGRFGFPDTQFYKVTNVALPVPFAGHVGFTQPDGSTVLAGGWAGETGAHSRRVVLVLSDNATPPVHCDEGN
jgi:hypothetical protein